MGFIRFYHKIELEKKFKVDRKLKQTIQNLKSIFRLLKSSLESLPPERDRKACAQRTNIMPVLFGNVEQIAFAENGLLVIRREIRKSIGVHPFDVHLTGVVKQMRIVEIVVRSGQFGRVEAHILGTEHLT